MLNDYKPSIAMEGKLLSRECDFYKLNEQLEKRAQQLFKEVEYVMKVDAAATQECEPTLDDSENKIKHSNLKQNSHSIEFRNKSPYKELDVERQTEHHVAEIKIQVLQKEKEQLQIKLKGQIERWKVEQDRVQKLQEEHAKLQRQSESSFQSSQKQQDQLREMTALLGMRETENVVLKKENESLKKQLRKKCQEFDSNSVRLNRSLEENAKLKAAAKATETDEKESRDAILKEKTQLKNTISCLEKQKDELCKGLKKQLMLIDNLKQQMMHMEVSKFVQFAEDEFSRILDSKMDSDLLR